MRTLWTLFKIIIGLAIAIPIGVVVLALTLGVLAGLLGLAVLALKLVVVAIIGYALFKVGRHLFAPTPTPTTQPARELTKPDPYYEAAMRDLNAHIRRTSDR